MGGLFVVPVRSDWQEASTDCNGAERNWLARGPGSSKPIPSFKRYYRPWPHDIGIRRISTYFKLQNTRCNFTSCMRAFVSWICGRLKCHVEKLLNAAPRTRLGASWMVGTRESKVSVELNIGQPTEIFCRIRLAWGAALLHSPLAQHQIDSCPTLGELAYGWMDKRETYA